MGKKAKRPLKVLQAPLDHANQAYVLSQALRARGVDSHLLRYQWESNPTATKFCYEEDRVAEISRDDWFGDLLRNVQKVAAEGFDIIHFWDRTLLWRRRNDFFNAMDLPFLRLAGARFAYRFTGYELRRRSLELDINPFTPYRYGFENRFDEDDQKRYFDSLAPYVDAFVVQDPEVQTYCPEARIIPRALDLAQFPAPEPARNKRPLVVHAPSEGKLKGSEFVIKATDVLKEEGLDFDFVLIENMPKTEALELCRRADVVIDQLLVGWYGVLSIEALAMGKTVIAYIRDDLTGYFRDGMPLVNANPQSIGTALREVVKDGELRRELGRKARAFVEEVHDSRVVARSAAKLYKKMLKAPASRLLPDFGYQLSHSVDVARRLDADLLSENRERLSELEQRVAALKTAREAAEIMAIQAATEHASEMAALRKIIIPLREKAERYDELELELPTLREKANHYNQLSEELPLLRRDARRYEELKAALPALRYKSKRYDELKNVALVWRAKADRFDRFAAKRWVRFVLPLLGLPLGFKSQRAHQPGSPKTAANGRGGPRAATGGAVGETSEGDPAGGTAPGLKQPDTTSTPIVRQPVSRQTLAQACGAVIQFGVVAEVRAILRIARVPKRRTPRAAGSAARQGVAASPVIEQQTGPPVHDRGVVCIVTRKLINNITRAPRMAKALADAGYAVVVVSRGRPVPQLRDMCRQVEYLEVTLGSLVRDLTIRCEDFRRRRENYRGEREAEYQAAMAKGGIRALVRRFSRAAQAPLQRAAGLSWRLFVVTPSALLLRKPSQRFALRWRELALQDAVGITRELALAQNQRWLTHTFANEADKATRGNRFDIVQAYDSYALVAAARLAERDGAKLVYDAVELTSHRLALDLNLVERKRERAERREEARIVREADGTIAIGEGLADWCARHYRRPRPVVVRNCRYFWPYQVDARLRADAGVGPEARLLVWCGLAYPQQGIEILIKALPHLAAHIHIAIIGFFQPRWKSYVQEVLPALAASLGVANRLHFLPEREPNDLVPYISGADLGVIPRSRDHLNNFFSMPNKFLEMVMARLPIAVSQVGDMVDLVKKHEMGGVFNERDSADIAAVIEGMLEPLKYALLKANVMKAAEVLTWENESLPYVALIDSLAPRHAGRSAKAGRAAESERVGQLPSGFADKVVEIPGKPIPAGAKRNAPGRAGLIEENQRLSARYDRAVERIKRLQVTHDNLQILSRFYRDNLIVNHYLRFARYCYEQAGDIKAEAYVAHGVEVLPAADVVAKAVGGRVYCDVIEMPSFAQRSIVYDWHPTNMSLLNHAFEGYLRGAAGLSTVGWALGRKIQHFGPKVTVIPNYRCAEPLRRSDQIRERCGLREEDRLLLASNTIASGLEPIVEALKLLPDNVHLATLGNVFREYRGQIQATVARLGVENRVHFFDPVPYDQFATVASGANIGLIAIDPRLIHWQISLPNRLFDCIAAGLPIVTPNVPDIARIVEGRRIGVTLANSDAGSWADAIAAALAGENALRPNVLAASEALVWESLGDKLHAAYDHAASITIIGFTNLIGHQRTIRMADTLIRRGVKVTICCPHEGQVPLDEMPGIRVVSTPKPQPGTTPMKAPAALAAKIGGGGTTELPSAAPSAAGNATSAAKANVAAPVLALSAFASAPKFRDGPTTVVEEL